MLQVTEIFLFVLESDVMFQIILNINDVQYIVLKTLFSPYLSVG
jgi:hypothetical protein